MMGFEERPDTFIVECMGTRCDKEGLANIYSKEAFLGFK
jgi:hypothetical protein